MTHARIALLQRYEMPIATYPELAADRIGQVDVVGREKPSLSEVAEYG